MQNRININRKLLLISPFLLGSILGALLSYQLSNIYLANFIGLFIIGFIYGYRIRRYIYLNFWVTFSASLTTFSGLMLLLFKSFYTYGYVVLFLQLITAYLGGYFILYVAFLLGRKIK